MKIEEVKEHYKDAKIVESHEGFEFELVEIDDIKSGVLGCNRGCYYYHGRTIYTPFDGFIKIIEYKTKAIKVSYTLPTYLNELEKATIVVPNGMILDESSIKFKKIEKELPNNWCDFIMNDNDASSEFCDDFNDAPNKYQALRKLELLRDCYNDGWVADYKNDLQDKHCIHYISSRIQTMVFTDDNAFLNFKTADLRDKFLENFKDVIEIAKPLL